VLASGCYDDGHFLGYEESLTAADTLSSSSDDSGSASGISTVTGITESASGDTTTGGDTDGTITGGGSSQTTGDTSTSTTGPDAAPVVEEFTVEHEAVSLEVSSAGPLVLRATVVDDVGVASVDFFWNGQFIGSDLEKPFEWIVPVDSDELDGEHTAYAVAHDTAEQASEKSGIVDVAIQLPLSGSVIWQELDSDVESRAHAVVVDSKGDAIAVGRKAVLGDVLRTQILIRKYDGSTGEELWERALPPEGMADGFSVAHGVAVDRLDNIYVVGDYNPDDDGGYLWIGKFGATGSMVKDVTHSLTGSNGRGIAIDTTGEEDRVFVTGYVEKLSHDSGYIAEVTPSLGPVWNVIVDDPVIKSNRVYGIAIDSQGYLVLSGSYDVNPTQRRGMVLKYDSKGDQKWWRATDAMANTRVVGYSVVLGADDEIIGVGRRADENFAEALWLFSFDSAGNELKSFIDSDAMCGPDGCSIASDASGHLLVAGAISNDQSSDFLVRKVKADWGEDLWSKAVDGYDGGEDRSLGVAVDLRGYVYSAGFETKKNATHWSVIKLNP